MHIRIAAVVAAGIAAAACQTNISEQPGAERDAVRTVPPAQHCAAVTPLPRDLIVTPAGADVPEHLARFLGVWSGTWNGDSCGTLAVTSVAADGAVAVIYAWDPKLGNNDENPRHLRGKIDGDGELSIRLGLRQTEVVYRFATPSVLHGRYYRNGVWDIDMAKVVSPTVGG